MKEKVLGKSHQHSAFASSGRFADDSSRRIHDECNDLIKKVGGCASVKLLSL